jgi:hypothetical protein
LSLVIFNGTLYIVKDNYTSGSFISLSSALLLISSFAVYFFIASYYAKRRKIVDGVLLFDISMGIILETLIVILACTLYGLVSAVEVMFDNGRDILQGSLSITLVSGLWIVAVFGLQLLIVGIISGGFGWHLLKRK